MQPSTFNLQPFPVRIRPATTQDFPAIRRVARASWAAAYSGLITERNQCAFLARSYSDRWLARRFQRPGSRVVVAEAEDEVVAYASSEQRARDGAELTSLYVLPHYQGHGVGTALLAHELGALAARGMQVLLVLALRENWPARRFYERRGFQVIGEQTARVGDQEIVETVYARLVVQG